MLHYGRFSPDIGIEPERDRLKLRRNNKFKKSSSLTKIPSCDANFFISSQQWGFHKYEDIYLLSKLEVDSFSSDTFPLEYTLVG